MLVQNLAIRQSQISAEMVAVQNFSYRQIRQTAIRTGYQMQPRWSGKGVFQINVLKMIPHRLRNFQPPINTRNEIKLTLSFFIPSSVIR
jgi:hypothetical protein